MRAFGFGDQRSAKLSYTYAERTLGVLGRGDRLRTRNHRIWNHAALPIELRPYKTHQT